MSLYLYDEAILKKIQNWVGGTNLRVLRADDTAKLFELQAEDSEDKSIVLPILSIRRMGGYSLLNSERTVMSASGLSLAYTPEKNEWLNAIPIQIEYQLDVYTRYAAEADEYMRNIIFNIINFPRVTIEIPYMGEKIKHDSSIHIDSQITDNSSVPERLIQGQFTRLTCRINITDAYIWDVRVKDNQHIDSTSVKAQPENLRSEVKVKNLKNKKFKLPKEKIGFYDKNK